LLLPKFLKILKELFSKSSLSGCRAAPCGFGDALPQGALPLEILLLSLKERSKEAFMAENSVFGRDLRISRQKTQFFAITKVFEDS